MKRILCVLTMLLTAACFADGMERALVNPLFRKWQNRRKGIVTNLVTEAQVKKPKMASLSSESEVYPESVKVHARLARTRPNWAHAGSTTGRIAAQEAFAASELVAERRTKASERVMTTEIAG